MPTSLLHELKTPTGAVGRAQFLHWLLTIFPAVILFSLPLPISAGEHLKKQQDQDFFCLSYKTDNIRVPLKFSIINADSKRHCVSIINIEEVEWLIKMQFSCFVFLKLITSERIFQHTFPHKPFLKPSSGCMPLPPETQIVWRWKLRFTFPVKERRRSWDRALE